MEFICYYYPFGHFTVFQQFKNNVSKVNGGKDFDEDMLEDIFNAIRYVAFPVFCGGQDEFIRNSSSRYS